MGVGGKDHSLATLRAGKSPCANSSGDWVGPRTGLVRSGKLCPPTLYSTPGPSSPQRPAIPTMLCRPTLLSLRRPTVILTRYVMICWVRLGMYSCHINSNVLIICSFYGFHGVTPPNSSYEHAPQL